MFLAGGQTSFTQVFSGLLLRGASFHLFLTLPPHNVFPPVPDSSSPPPASVGPQSAQWMPVPTFLCVWSWERLLFKEKKVTN